MTTHDAAAPGRRAEYAEVTRQAILDAARALFRERGFVATRVQDIAAYARVAPATVYAVGGGKEALLHSWVAQWLASPEYAESHEHLQELTEPEAILALTASVVATLRARWGDVLQVARTTAAHDPGVASSLELATRQYRQGFLIVAQRLSALGALRPEVSPTEAAEVLWFYFGFGANPSLVEDSGWPSATVEAWLTRAAGAALFAPVGH